MTATTTEPTTTVMVEVLTDFYDDARNCPTCEGSQDWYYRKSAAIQAAATVRGYTMAEATAAYAVLSANASVLENDRNFVRVVHGAPSVGFGDRQRRAELALSGDIAGAIDYLNGEKIPSFFDNLLDPSTSTAVTIDRHAADIVTDDRAMSKRILARSHRTGYHKIADVYLAVAAMHDVLPHELQARVWVHHVNCMSTTSTTTVSATARKA